MVWHRIVPKGQEHWTVGMSSGTTTAHLERCLKLLDEGDVAARTMLLEFAGNRLKILADRMFIGMPQLRGHEQADDLFQEARLRLWQALERVHPTTVAGFMGLAAVHTRYALIDLIRKYRGHNFKRPEIRYGDPMIEQEPESAANSPESLARWSEFHTAAAELPEKLRMVFDLLYYEGLPNSEAADLMEVSLRQLQRYWREARLNLCEMLDGCLPDS